MVATHPDGGLADMLVHPVVAEHPVAEHSAVAEHAVAEHSAVAEHAVAEHSAVAEHAVAEHPVTAEPIVAGRPAPGTPDVHELVVARGRRIATLRRTLTVADTVATAGLVLALVGTHPLAAVTALALCLVVLARLFTADAPRTLASVRAVLRTAAGLAGVACVAAALLDLGSGREVLLGAASGGAVLALVRGALRVPGPAEPLGLGRRRRMVVGDPSALERVAPRQSSAVASGEVMPVVTRANRPDPGPFAPERDQRTGNEDTGGPSGMVARIVRTALLNSVERVSVIPGRTWQTQQLRELSWLLEGTGIDMVISTDLDGIAPHRVDVVHQQGRLMIRVGSASPRGTRALAKGLLDRSIAAVLLVLASPVLVAIAVAVRLDSPGPALFHQRRVREHGNSFVMHKFRTMHTDAERQLTALQDLNEHKDGGPLFKVRDDPRITRVGHFLRKTSLDELPQLLNVLCGTMSLIGPRPALPVEVATYDHVAKRRLAVKPGMTGLWQVSGRSGLSWDQSIGFDLEYVDNWSPAKDAAIAMRTFRAVMTKDGAF